MACGLQCSKRPAWRGQKQPTARASGPTSRPMCQTTTTTTTYLVPQVWQPKAQPNPSNARFWTLLAYSTVASNEACVCNGRRCQPPRPGETNYQVTATGTHSGSEEGTGSQEVAGGQGVETTPEDAEEQDARGGDAGRCIVRAGGRCRGGDLVGDYAPLG